MQKLFKAMSFAKELNKHITFANIRNKLEERGWNVVLYNTPHGDEYLMRLSRYLPQYAKTTPGFAFKGKISQCVCIDGNLSETDRTQVILHESGHVILGHPALTEQTLSAPKNPAHETEADKFAQRVTMYRRNVKAGIVAMLIVAIIVAGVGIAVSHQSASTSNNPGNVSNTTAPGSFCVTKDGDKYHRATCPYVSGKKVLEITLDEAKQLYQPCKYCCSDLQ